MTIRPGQDWGETVARPPGLVPVASDAELAAHVAGGDARPLLLTGGDLLATMGGRRAGAGLHRVSVDVLRVAADGRSHLAVAHVLVRRRGRLGWWRGPVVAVMNAEHHGPWDVAPGAHPNDGRADVVEVAATMPARARWQARRRLATGTHVPHPDIRTTRTTARRWRFDPPLRLWVDGVACGTVRSLEIAVVADGAVVHV